MVCSRFLHNKLWLKWRHEPWFHQRSQDCSLGWGRLWEPWYNSIHKNHLGTWDSKLLVSTYLPGFNDTYFVQCFHWYVMAFVKRNYWAWIKVIAILVCNQHWHCGQLCQIWLPSEDNHYPLDNIWYQRLFAAWNLARGQRDAPYSRFQKKHQVLAFPSGPVGTIWLRLKMTAVYSQCTPFIQSESNIKVSCQQGMHVLQAVPEETWTSTPCLSQFVNFLQAI
jgi:hypothetical protein